jgi:branched-chain amino acid transport system substrate-binding protein
MVAVSYGSLHAGASVKTSSPGASQNRLGVTAKTITIGATVPLSGVAANYAEVSTAANAVFEFINKRGGINGRKIIYIRKDDCYGVLSTNCTSGFDATTLSQTVALVTQDHVFADVGSLGTATQITAIPYLNLNGVPNLFVNSGSPLLNQAKYPRLFGFQTSYQTEGKIFARWIRANLPHSIVGTIGQSDDFATSGLTGLLEGGLTIATTDQLTYSVSDAATQSYTDIQQDLLKLKSDKVNVVVLDSITPITSAILATAAQIGYGPQWVISSNGSDPISVNSALEVGAITLDFLPPSTMTNNPWIGWIKKVIKNDPNAKSEFPSYFSGANAGIVDENMMYGASYAVAFCEAVQSLGRNVTRSGLVRAMTTTRFATPSLTALYYGIGNHQGLQGGSIARITANHNPANPPQFPTLLANTEYTTGDYANTPIVTYQQTIEPIPAWLK